MFGHTKSWARGVAMAALVAGALGLAAPATVSAAGRGGRPAQAGCDHHRYDAGTLCIDGCHYRIRSDGAYRAITRAFRREGHRAYLRYSFGERVVRVYGRPVFSWSPDLYDAHVHRRRGYVEITLCGARR